MLTVWPLTKRSARFYGKYVGQSDQTHQELPKEFPHQVSPPFAGKWLTAISATAPLSGSFRSLFILSCRAAFCQFCCLFWVFPSVRNPGLCLDKPGRGGIMKRRKGAAASGWPLTSHSYVIYADRLGTSQAVSTLLWSVCRSKRPDIPKISKEIFPSSLTSLHREVANRCFAATPLSDPLRGITQYSTG